jgi:23S rRNA pseudouridine955/2504/2580 synthase
MMPGMNDSPSSSTVARARIVPVDAERAGQRIDNFLLVNLKGVPRSRIYRMLRKGEVRVNKGRVKACYRLQAGDAVRIPPLYQAQPAPAGRPSTRALESLEQGILFEDQGLLVLNKPSGMAVHGGSGLSYGVIEALRGLRPQAPYLELVHRLDRDTSGCLIIAKRRSVLRELHRLLRGDGLDKRYLTLVKGHWQGGERRVDVPLLKNTLRSGERIVTVDAEGKPSVSLFRPHTLYTRASLMEVRLLTGRTHQIRVHGTAEGFPIAGDEKYGDTAFNRKLKEQTGLRRLFLHAHSVAFELPGVAQSYRITASLGKDLETVLTRLVPRQDDVS